jgi:aryl-alcohol dehydrogenase-like predicted oxidoreductase
MNKRPLGRTGYRVTEIGLGAWGLGGDMFLDVDPRSAQRAVYAAIDAGIDFIDTALVYGDGQSERLVGEAIRDLRARDWVVLATKVPPRNDRWPAAAEVPLAQVFPPAHVVRCVEQSLRNTRLEVLPLVQLHVWHDTWLDQSTWPALGEAMVRLVREGKVLHWGISVNDHAPETALRAVGEPLIETVQVIYNVFDQSPAAELFGRAREHDVGVIARCPFDEGGLTGRIGPDTRFHPDDFRSRYFRGSRKQELAARLRRLEALLGGEVQTLPELALRFCLDAEAVSTVIPGMRRPEHLQQNLGASDGRRLGDALRARLAEQAWARNWYE